MTARASLLRLAAAASLGLLAVASGAPGARAADAEEPRVFNFVRFEPIIVTLFDSNRVTGLMSVTLTLQVPTPQDKDEIEARRTKYIDAFNADLARLGRLYINPNRPLDVKRLASTLEATANRLHGKGKVRALIIDASTRRNG